MQSAQTPSEQARAAYEDHVRTCRYCAGRGGMCQSAKLLRRTYNNVLRAGNDSVDVPGRRAPDTR
ncbi:hypothetical protein [Streptomyces sp. NPDC048521]|uniref:hypothetical protein n=1 Tax=Streptomyces sp. NPDC048521 TaxID=3365566 RepID=UPI00371BC888